MGRSETYYTSWWTQECPECGRTTRALVGWFAGGKPEPAYTLCCGSVDPISKLPVVRLLSSGDE